MPPAVSSHEKLLLLFELSSAFNALIELDELLESINAKTRDVLDAENCAILLLDEEKGELFFPVSSDRSPEIEDRFHAVRFPADKGIAGWVLQNNQATLVSDVSRDPRFYAEVDRQSGAQTRELLYAPLRTRRGVIGVMGLRNKRRGAFTEEDLAFVEALAGSVALAIENAALYARVKTSEARLRSEVGALRRDLARRDRFAEIVGTGAAIASVFRLMESAAASTIPVLIEGETGTGKELVARGIHRESERAQSPFLAVNCAALTESLLESELFGHRRGAFTGATGDKAGLFEAAIGGTIFLDEIGEMPPAMQPKLLRVLQEGEVTPVGDTRPRKVDVRVISATNRDLASEAATDRFRRDLYYRVAAFPIHLPPLRERQEDIPLLVQRTLTAAGERSRKRIAGIEPAAMELLMRFNWPGNVRELQNEIERAVALARDGDTIGPGHLSLKIRGPVSAEPAAHSLPKIAVGIISVTEPAAVRSTLRDERAAFEAQHIAEELAKQCGNVARTAQALGMSRVTLYKKMKDYRLR